MISFSKSYGPEPLTADDAGRRTRSNPILACLAILLLTPAAVLSAIGNPLQNGPDAETLLQFTQHFTEPAKGPEFVMPVGSGDLSAMVSFDTAGVNMTAIQEMLLQSHDLAQEEKLLDGGPIRLLPCVRTNWSGSFNLRARGGFLVTCEFEKGAVKHAVIQSERGRKLQVVNPFATCVISLNGQPQAPITKRLIELSTKPGETVELSASKE